jgi:HEAT repeat protein
MLWWAILRLHSSNPETRLKAAVQLASAGDPRAIPILITALKDDQFWIIRKTAVEALGELRDFRALEPLLAALTDESPGVREAAARGLGKMRNPQAAEPLLKLLDTTQPWSLRMAAVEALGEIGDPQAVEPLLDILRSGDSWRLRRTAIEALGKIKDDLAVEPLMEVLGDRYASVREAAALALGEIGDPRATDPLITALENGKLWALRRAAAQALGALGGSQAIAPLIKLLKDKYANVREAAVRALGQVGSPQAVEPLLRATKDRDSMVRVAAARALDVLACVLSEEERRTLRAATVGDHHYEAVDPDATVKESLFAEAFATRAIAERAIQLLEHLLSDRKTDIDAEILRQIAHLKDLGPVDPERNGFSDAAAILAQPVDCSLVQKLARQALVRCGLEA